MTTQIEQDDIMKEDGNQGKDFPAAFVKAQRGLDPYIKTRQEVANIRRILAAHLDTQLRSKSAHPKLSFLSLVDSETTVKASSEHLEGLRKEYIRSLRLNIKARKEYNDVCQGISSHKCGSVSHGPEMVPASNTAAGLLDNSEYLNGYLNLVKQKQQLERVQIMQECLNNLEQHSASTFLDSGGLGIFPKLQDPPEVFTGSGGGLEETSQNELKSLVRDLEIAVLRAKATLRNERHLIELVKTSRSTDAKLDCRSTLNDAQILQALGHTRDELITWIEEELGKAGDSTPLDVAVGQAPAILEAEGTIEEQSLLIKDQYAQYIKARKALLETIIYLAEPELLIDARKDIDSGFELPEKEAASSATSIMAPYLYKLHTISNEQKSLIQQKSHLTVCLAKQYKETVQVFDRLADESHLLPIFPSSAMNEASRGTGIGQFKVVESMDKEVPNASHRVRGWTLAAESARSATQDTVLSSKEEADDALQSAHDVLSTLNELFASPITHPTPENIGRIAKTDEDIWLTGSRSRPAGSYKTAQRSLSPSVLGDIWESLDGRLGVLIKDDE